MQPKTDLPKLQNWTAYWKNLVVRWQGSDVLAYAKSQGWDDVRICGCGKMLTSPKALANGWLLVPQELDESIIPAEGQRRLEVLAVDRAIACYAPARTLSR